MSRCVDNTPVQLLCRLCSKIADKYYNALSNAFIQVKVKRYLCFEIKESDSHSKLICEPCLRRITEFDAYCNEVAKYQQRLQNGKQPQIVRATVASGNGKIAGNKADQPKQIDLVQAGSAGSNQRFCSGNGNGQESSVGQVDSDVKDSCRPGNAISRSDETGNASSYMLVDVPVDNDDDYDNVDIDENDDDIDFADDDGDECIDNNVEPHSIGHLQLDTFPKKLIEHTSLIVKGAELNELISRFYLLDCDYCTDDSSPHSKKVRFCDLAALLQHYVDKHQMKGYVVCCNTKLVKIRAMGMHMARHLQPDAFKCPQCAKVLTCPRILQYHIQNHLPEAKRPLACGQCPRRFSYRGALAAHTISHQPEHERVAYICDECGKEFKTGGRLTNHINVEHIDDAKRGQDHVCNVCSKRFTYGCNLAYHMTTHQPFTQQVQCAECGKWLKNKSCLRKHMYQHSTVRYTCSQCPYSALNQQCLKRHVKVQHSDDKPFECGDCGKAFKLKTTLVAHTFQHTGDRKYVCEFCDRSFVSNGNYYSHRKRMHPEELAAVQLQKEHERRRLREPRDL